MSVGLSHGFGVIEDCGPRVEFSTAVSVGRAEGSARYMWLTRANQSSSVVT